jgi:predicted DCC family thiol-disulfide oxidoreductase YuxK
LNPDNFDGVCNLCNGLVQFIIRRDKKAIFMFGTLQSEKAEELLDSYNIPTGEIKTIILIEDGKAFRKSTAALRILSRLPGWAWIKIFMIVPRVIRDFVYDLVAKYRYKIFGKKETCMIPTSELKARFLE